MTMSKTAYRRKQKAVAPGRGLAKRPLGRILVDGEFITPAALDAALAEQQRTNEHLGEILVRLGVLDPVDLAVALSVQRDLVTVEAAVNTAAGVRRMLGEMLLQAKRITKGQLDEALREQAATGEKLGAVLVRLGHLRRNELDTALTFQKNQEDKRLASTRLTLGELLVAANYISREQLADALARQQRSNKKLGEVLVEAGYAKPHQITHGLRLQEKLITAALVAAFSLSTATPLSAMEAGGGPSAGATITVSARVLPRASLTLLRQVSEIVITDADIRRGFMDIDTGSVFDLKNNSRAGCLLTFSAQGLPVKEVLVRGFDREVSLGPGGGMISHAFKGTLRVTLSYRFIFAGGVQAGTYQWPLAVTASPL